MQIEVIVLSGDRGGSGLDFAKDPPFGGDFSGGEGSGEDVGFG